MGHYLINLILAIKSEHLVILIGDSLIILAFLSEGIAIIKSKQISRLSLFSYLLYTGGSVMWLIYGASSKNYWVITSNFIAVTIQFSVLIVIFYILKISHTKTFIKFKKKTSY